MHLPGPQPSIKCSAVGQLWARKPSPHPLSNAAPPFRSIFLFFTRYFCPIQLIPQHVPELIFQFFVIFFFFLKQLTLFGIMEREVSP